MECQCNQTVMRFLCSHKNHTNIV